MVEGQVGEDPKPVVEPVVAQEVFEVILVEKVVVVMPWSRRGEGERKAGRGGEWMRPHCKKPSRSQEPILKRGPERESYVGWIWVDERGAKLN